MSSYYLLRILRVKKANIGSLAYTGLSILSILGLLLGVFSPAPVQAATAILYATPGGLTTGSCDTWGGACQLAYALKTASAGSEIWVKEGTYSPGSSPADAFLLKQGVALYGGFLGNETAREQANWYTHPTVLSGDVAGDDLLDLTNMAENNHHVVIANDVDSTALLSGFFIRSGNARGTGTAGLGGAVQVVNANPTLKDLVLSNNYADRGAGIGCFANKDGEVSLTNIRYEKNQAQLGGGLYAEAGCIASQYGAVFSANRADAGGAIYNTASTLRIINASLSGNTASTSGGGIVNNSVMMLGNSILWNNHLQQGLDQIKDSGTLFAFQNIIQGGFAGVDNRDLDPRFVENPTSGADQTWGTADDTPGNLMLRYDSPAIDAGNPTVLPDSQMRDLRNWPRIIDHPRPDTPVGPLVDLGGYEAGIIFTRQGATGRQDGSSWKDAFPELSAALAFAHAGDEVWAAAGVYQTGTDRTSTFSMKNDLAIYGGFAGTETFRDERDWQNNKSILSGLNTPNATRSYHVVSAMNIGPSAVLDGFTIMGGNADGAQAPENQGGGIYLNNATPTLANLTITQNTASLGGGAFISGQAVALTDILFSNNQAGSGAGLYMDAVNLSMSRLTFQDNQATDSGGGLYSNNASYHLTGATFLRNTAVNGAGIANFGTSAPILLNIYFEGNVATSGGAMYNANGASPDLSNAIFAGNKAISAGGVYNTNLAAPALRNVTMVSNPGGAFYSENNDVNLEPLLVNMIGWNNTAQPIVTQNSIPVIKYSLLEGGCPPQLGDSCTNVLSNDPLFYKMPSIGQDNTWGTADDDYGDLRLQPGSKAIDAGMNSGVAAGVTTDIAGRPRFLDDPTADNTGLGSGPIVDMGAYENRVAPSTTKILSVSAEPSYAGQEVTVTFQVEGNLGTTATGQVQVINGGAKCSAPANTGQCKLTFSTPGSKMLTAHFAGDETYDPSDSSPYVHQVKRIPTTVTLSLKTISKTIAGYKLRASFVVSPALDTTYQPGGSVTVSSTAGTCTAAITEGGCDLFFTQSGAHTFTAAYSGDTFFEAQSSNPVTYTAIHNFYLPIIYR